MAQAETAQSHSLFWWYLKVMLGLALVTGVVARFVYGGSMTHWDIPRELGQFLVVVGVGLYLYHYGLLRARNPSMRGPAVLLDTRGFYRLVRHPMYFSDIVYYAGLALLWPSALSVALWVLAAIALQRQARVEDRWCRQQFGEQHSAWSRETRLLVPFIY